MHPLARIPISTTKPKVERAKVISLCRASASSAGGALCRRLPCAGGASPPLVALGVAEAVRACCAGQGLTCMRKTCHMDEGDLLNTTEHAKMARSPPGVASDPMMRLAL